MKLASVRDATTGLITSLLVGCSGDLLDTRPPLVTTDAARSSLDGGVARFIPQIEADIDSLGCAAGGCHLAPSQQAPSLVPTPTSDTDQMANYIAFKAQCDATTPAMSNVLLYPAEMGAGAQHPGGQILMVGDATYTRWENWISGGEQYQ